MHIDIMIPEWLLGVIGTVVLVPLVIMIGCIIYAYWAFRN